MTRSTEIEMALFDAARNLPDPAVCSAFLDQACNGDTAMRSRLERMLQTQSQAEKFFSSPIDPEAQKAEPETASDSLPITEEMVSKDVVGARIGRYKLLQRLGEGGCGVVYLAEQEEPVQRRVALKIIRLGMDTESVIARFAVERQALAMMDHPNIARVLDAGATESGRPYFVMELVMGTKLTEYCKENRLSIDDRLKLFVQICHAIQHAHQKRVIHRDIKPSNVLVALHDGVPVPKVIDFGIAKPTDGRITKGTVVTSSGQFIGTPAYMSPEQAETSGLDVDTRSDIYSLGALLYELLTGRPPFDSTQLLKSGMEQMRRTLREDEPLAPSALLASLSKPELNVIAFERRIESSKLVSLLKGDLDWIVMKALEKDRQRRYQTANGLAVDAHRFLTNEPVIARPPSRLYQLGKLARRNKGAFAAVTVVVIALVSALGVSTWLLGKEREDRNRAVAAERQQAILRAEAERGLANQAKLRQLAEARESVARAAVLLSADRMEEADKLVAAVPLEVGAVEGAAVFRRVGEWNAVQKQWNQAADRLKLLVRASQFDTLDTLTLDQTRYAAALIEAGDMERYEQFRHDMIENYAGTADPVVAERTVKLALLTPPPQTLLNALIPLAELAARSIPTADQNLTDWQIPWRCVSLGLMEYRRGRYAEAIAWSKRSVQYGGNSSRSTSAQLIEAISLLRLGQIEEAQSKLNEIRPVLEPKFGDGWGLGDSAQGFWFDWLLARKLFRETSALIEETITPEPPL